MSSNDPINERLNLLELHDELRRFGYMIEDYRKKVESEIQRTYRIPSKGDLVTPVKDMQNFTTRRVYYIRRADQDWFWLDDDNQIEDRMTMEYFNLNFVFISAPNVH